MWNCIESAATSEMNGVNLTVGMKQRIDKVEISNKICDCRIRFNESMLMGTEF
jgi:hypothetical protein